MDKNEDSGSPGWGASLFMQTEDVARAFLAATSAATVRSPHPSVAFSSTDDNGDSQIQKFRRHVSRMLKGLSPTPEVKGSYNPEILTSQKRQWARFQDQRSVKEPTKFFESMVVVGLHPSVDVQALHKLVLDHNNDYSKRRNLLNYNYQVNAESNLEPQVLFVYPPEKQLPLKYKDLLSFCFPGGLEVHAVERTPSLSELNEIILGQLKQSNQSFVFRLKAADDSTLYGCCVLVEEPVQKPSNLVSLPIGEKQCSSRLSRHILTTSRCYCILSRLPFFDMHFGILKSILIEERLEQLTKGTDMLNLLSPEETAEEDRVHNNIDSNLRVEYAVEEGLSPARGSDLTSETTPEEVSCDRDPISVLEPKIFIQNNVNLEVNQGARDPQTGKENGVCSEGNLDHSINNINGKKQHERHVMDAVLPLLGCQVYESSESSGSLQGSPCEDRDLRSNIDNAELEEPSSSGQEDLGRQNKILDWAKANCKGSLQIICEYYELQCPARGSTLTFQPLEHLHPLEFHRPGETVLHIAGSTIDLRSNGTNLEMAEVRTSLLAEEEATALSVWTVATICGCLRLEHILVMLAGALLEKQIVVICSNLGVLSASVLSVVPLIRPYQWHSLLMPVLPNDMLDFVDAPVPYIVGIKNKTADIQSKLANVILVDADKNQVKSPSMPQLPRHKELFSFLSPYYAKLVGESYLARRRPVYECTDVQIEAAKGFLAILRSYLDSFCSNLRSHTITNVQCNNDKVSVLLKDSYIDSFPYRDRSFMKLFVDTQLFSVHTDFVLSFYQKD